MSSDIASVRIKQLSEEIELLKAENKEMRELLKQIETNWSTAKITVTKKKPKR